MVARTGFEPVISALRGRCPWPLDERATTKHLLAGDRGFEPRLTDPESVVLPLDESPATGIILAFSFIYNNVHISN